MEVSFSLMKKAYWQEIDHKRIAMQLSNFNRVNRTAIITANLKRATTPPAL